MVCRWPALRRNQDARLPHGTGHDRFQRIITGSARNRVLANKKLLRLEIAIYCTFQPDTSTLGFAVPRSTVRYVALNSRLSPGSSETQLSCHKTGRISSPPLPLSTFI